MKLCLLKHAQEGYVSHLEYRMILRKQPKIGGGSASLDMSSERRLLVLNMFAQYHLRFIRQKMIH